MPPVKFVAHINVNTLEVTDYFYDEKGKPPDLIEPQVKPREERKRGRILESKERAS